MVEKRILIVDDERNMRQLVRVYLTSEGYHLDEASSGMEAMNKVQQQVYDVLILDIMMPGTDGWEVCQRLRRTGAETAILMLTAKTDVEDRVKGLNLGADDYLVKPFAPEELVARVNALLRRKHRLSTEDSRKVVFQELLINPDLYEVKIAGKPVELTSKEFDIFYLMAKRTERVYTRENIMEQIFSMSEGHGPRTIDTHIKNIRIKLKNGGLPFNPIKTVWGVGYKFNSPEGQ
ncbi:response regulator transcription factor [Shouchella shacheensis]|uniref:response regulator transcription factor n=1 Tax=Shouchella shacheensis TaxID=1649580 RepID=UPI000AFD847D|nr:response regulator transcription factor [Shouchella shacheensis]